MATHQRIRSVLKNAGFKIGHYEKGRVCPRFVGGDIIVSRPFPGRVHISLYRKKDQSKLQEISDFLKKKGYSVEFNGTENHIGVD